MKYWFRNTSKYNFPKPITWEGWVVTVGYFVLAVLIAYTAYVIAGSDQITYLILMVVSLLVVSLIFTYVRETRTDPASIRKKVTPKIKGGKKKRF